MAMDEVAFDFLDELEPGTVAMFPLKAGAVRDGMKGLCLALLVPAKVVPLGGTDTSTLAKRRRLSDTAVAVVQAKLDTSLQSADLEVHLVA